MVVNLEPVKEVLRLFYSEIAAVEKIRMGISAPIRTPFSIKDRTPDLSNVDFDLVPDSYWLDEDAYIWIYAEARHFHQLMSHPKNNKVPGYYLQPAQPIYEDWRDEERDVIYRGTIIPPPGEDNLNDYLISLAACIQEGNEKRAVWIKSLKSFLQYVRDDTPIDLQGTLDCIFPYKMDIRRGDLPHYAENTFIEREHGF